MIAQNKSWNEILQSLTKARSFSHLQKEKLTQLASLGKFLVYPQGTTILSEGDQNQDLFFLLKGKVSVYSGGNFVCHYGRAGDIFGEMSVVSEGPVSATVVTNEEVEVIVIDGSVVGGFKSSKDHDLVITFYKLFSLSLLEKLRLTTLKARMFEDAIRHSPLQIINESAEYLDKSAEKHLNETLLTSLAVHTADQAIIVADVQGRVLRFNLAAENLFSMIELQVVKRPLESLMEAGNDQQIVPKLLHGKLSSWRGELNFISGNGDKFPTRTSLSNIMDPEGRQIGLLCIVSDISKEKKLEAQLRQSQKMEAVGQLAGGIAHDFNNLLQIITSYTQLALRNVACPDKMEKDLQTVLNATTRGASLTNRLLTFSRNKVFSKKNLLLNDVVQNIGGLMGRLIDKDIQLEIVPGEDLWEVYADSNQIEQALTNLFINARDAMSRGGVLRLETKNMLLDAAFCNLHYWARPGSFVRISIQDTGTGMDAKQMERIFEPFFTTKEPGQGTGLGMSMVMGIVEAHEGFLHVESEIGRGSTIAFYLPRVDSKTEGKPPQYFDGPVSGKETILLAEDEEDIRIIIERVLMEQGYVVLSAADGVEAEAIFTQNEGGINLLLFDAIMPRMGGRELYRRIQTIRPDLPVLFISGFSPDSIGSDALKGGKDHFIRKPFSNQQLLQEVRLALDSRNVFPALNEGLV